jgi:HK97 gp10 family phage protein
VSVIREWRQREFVALISGRVTINMDAACQFAVGQAQSKAPRRTGRLVGDIAYTVSGRGNVVEGRVGVLRGKGRAYWGWFHEVGTSKMPAHPFLRPAVFGNAAEILRLIRGG